MGKFDFDDLYFEKGGYTGFNAYSRSKMANIYFSREMASRVQGVKVCSVDPGPVRTGLNRYMIEGNPCMMYCCLCCCCPLTYLVVRSPFWGAQTSLHCALMPIDQI